MHDEEFIEKKMKHQYKEIAFKKPKKIPRFEISESNNLRQT